jgi:four helix bundle protein
MSSLERFNFEKLRVYQDALEFSKQTYRITKRFPKDELFGLTSQFRRVASSIPMNIAEESSLTKTQFKDCQKLAKSISVLINSMQ